MRTDEDRARGIDIAHHQRQMFGEIDQRAEHDRGELAVCGGQLGLGDALHHRFVTQAILYDVRDGDDLEPVELREIDQVVAPRHRSVFLQNFADDAGRLESRQPREVDRAFGLAGAHQHAAVTRTQRIDITRSNETRRSGVLAHRLEDGNGAVLRRNPRAVASLRALIEVVNAVPSGA